MKVIELTVSPDGETRLETNGFQGSVCREASRFLESALGASMSETLKEEFHATESQENVDLQQDGDTSPGLSL